MSVQSQFWQCPLIKLCGIATQHQNLLSEISLHVQTYTCTGNFVLVMIQCNLCFIGMESTDISAMRHFVHSIEDALLFMTQMVIAEGWGVIRCHIKHYRWTSLICMSHDIIL